MKSILKNPSFSTFSELYEIAKPLYDKANLTYFGFCRIYPNKKFFNIATDPRWAEQHYLIDNLPPAGLCNLDSLQNGVMLPTLDSDLVYGWPEGTIRQVRDRFGIQDPIFVTKKFETYVEIFALAFNLANPYQFYLNHYEQLRQYIFYIKDNARPIINKASSNLLSHYSNKICESSKITCTQVDDSYDLKVIAKNYELQYQGQIYNISLRQYQVLHYAAMGYSNAMIADMLALSKRTIEGHVNRLMTLFQVGKKKPTC